MSIDQLAMDPEIKLRGRLNIWARILCEHVEQRVGHEDVNLASADVNPKGLR